ncbi:hypothetical protein D3C84_892200 [compost metagenome]
MGAGKLCLGHKLANFDTHADGGGVLLRRQNSLGTTGLLGCLAQWSLRRLPPAFLLMRPQDWLALGVAFGDCVDYLTAATKL